METKLVEPVYKVVRC